MTYVVTGNRSKCEFMDCLVPCPVDCFHEGETMLVIHPDECIDCGVCEIECPSEAILSDDTPGTGPWIELNRHYVGQWPNIPPPRTSRDGPTSATSLCN